MESKSEPIKEQAQPQQKKEKADDKKVNVEQKFELYVPPVVEKAE